jgi:hypothetical protein
MANTETTKGLRLYDTEQFIVTQVAREMFEGNESQAIRHMIREFGKRLASESPTPEPAPLFAGGNGQ